jgi:hypothetical protein
VKATRPGNARILGMTCTIGLHSLCGHTGASIVETPLIQQPLTICYPRQLQFALSSSFVFSRLGTQWAPNDIPNPVRVHGALYLSEAFIVTFAGKAHWRDSPGERLGGCLLPRIMVGPIFASDGTQLTAFSDARLLLHCLAIGDVSKY